MKADHQREPDGQEMPESARRNRMLIILATVVLAGIPLVLGTLRLMGYL